ncbi:uncharacterized protein C17orf80 homolog [Sebastes umbrosus]|uniref:uncharacterized protein C17orf80 homolog n=1 Tax=Sebastes umbrosus TaxID=72105 RepID=UPI0018A125F7|nr:uncharacterized protein C17orf80 homolog [Sebastes umbrosus]
MSSEVCPFCGKTYKRLKSHLPHCKAAASSKTPPTKHDVTVNETTTSSSQLEAASSEPTATQTPSMTAQSKKSKKMAEVSFAPPNASSPLSESSSLSPASLPPSSKKKKKQKLSEQIKTANVSLASSSSLPPSPTISKPGKQSLRVLIEAANQVSNKGSLEGARSASSEALPSASTLFVADPLSSRTTAETKTNPDKIDSIKDDAHPAVLSTKTKAASKMKVSKTKKAAQSLQDTSSSPDSRVNESRRRVRDDFWVDNEGEVEDLSVNKMLMKSGSGHQGRITLQDVKATLGRANAARKSGRPSILSQIETTEYLSSNISPVLLPAGYKGVDSCLVTTKTVSDQLQSFKRKQASLIPLQQLELASPGAPLHLSEVSKATSPPHNTRSMTEGLKMTGLLAISPSLTKFSSPLPAAGVGTLRADDGLKSQLEVWKQNTADKGAKGALTQRSLGQVRLRELPEWLACKTPGHPRDVVDMVQRGWRWYYRRYINVRKGGVGGPGMLLAGYCVLSYIWSYPHIKRDRWRKYH